MTTIEHRFAWAASPADPRLLFEATELPGRRIAIAWPDGSRGNLSPAHWARFRPVHAGFALIHGKRDRQALAGLHGEKRAKVAAFLEERAGRLMGPELLRWWRHGFAPSEARS